MSAPQQLRVEHLEQALGIDVVRPRMSWQLPSGSSHQLGYQIEAGPWSTGRVESDKQLLMPYEGPQLQAGERLSWRVKVWTDLGESDWSEYCELELGLLDEQDWNASWIEPVEQGGPEDLARPAQLLARDFEIDGEVETARLYATAHGIYEAFIDGVRVGDHELTPGFTQYYKRLQVQTFDVTDMLARGAHRLAILVSDGWYRGQVGGTREPNRFGERVGVLAQLRVMMRDGSVVVIGTDDEWRARRSCVVAADLIEGQTTHLDRDWETHLQPGALDPEWGEVGIAAHGYDRLCASLAPPVRRVEEIAPISVTRHDDGAYVVDLGQNINGWVRLSNLGPAGTTTTLRHGEALDPSGRVTVEHLVLEFDQAALKEAGVELPFETVNARRPLQVDSVVASGGDGEVFEPRHTTHGFRYVQVEGHPGPLTPADVTGIFVHTDVRRTGWFECSDERLNRLHDAAVRSLRGNICDVPTDCPQRERSGWTGDWQVFVPTAAYLYDVAGFSTKWLRDLAASQRPSGLVEHHAPQAVRPATHTGEESVDSPMSPGCAGWGDAAVIVPWEIYRSYGDLRLLEEQWPSMQAWVDYMAHRAATYRHPSRVATHPEPRPHERYLWDSGFQWGEWLEPGVDDAAFMALFANGAPDVATAYLHHSAQLLSRIARILGRENEAARYAELADNALGAWRTEFIADDGSLTPDTQANHVRALAFGLVPDELVGQTKARLVELIRAAGTHLGTGFLATPYLLPELARRGELDLAYELLLQESAPSWLSMINQGATTVWEFWEGLNSAGEATGSLNHYSKGAVVSFLHRNVAGIRLPDSEDAVAYREFVIQPEPGGGLTWAKGALDTPYGRIASSWVIDDNVLQLDVEVAPGTSATVILPNGEQQKAGPGKHTFQSRLPVPA